MIDSIKTGSRPPHMLVFLAILALRLAIPYLRPELSAAEFRVETTILDSADKAASRYRTIFTNDAIYDFQVGQRAKATVFEPRKPTVTILNAQLRLSSRIDAKRLAELTYARNLTALKRGSPVEQFAANPQFAVRFEPEHQFLELKGDQLSYSIVGIRKPSTDNSYSEAVGQYRAFADCYAKVNSIMGSFPAQARVKVNAELYRQKLLPKRVKRTIPAEGHNASSVHEYHWTLSPSDRQSIGRIDAQLGACKQVELIELLIAEKSAANSSRNE